MRTGYTQDDVISFAKVLTGWTLVPPGDNPEHGGEFIFNPRLHEPGAQTGARQDLRRTRASSRAAPCCAISRRIRRPRPTSPPSWRAHFIADEPPPPLVERLAKTFRDTDGDLKEVATTLVSSDEAWTQPRTKLKRPSEWVVGMVRATGITQADPARFTGGQALLGEPLWRPPSPKGYPDDEASWIDGMGRRLDIANNFAERVAGTLDPQAIIETCSDRGVGASEAGGRPRREPAAGAGAAVHVGRFSEEVSMALRRHLPSRREVLLGSGALFAWSQMPRLARAEGRDPRMLVIVLRGALDGLGAVAPVGDPDWVGLRGDRALLLDGKPPALPLDSLLRAQSRDAEPAPALQGAAGRDRACNRDALSRALAFRRPGRAGKRPYARPGAIDTGWLNRALLALASDGRVDPRGSRALGVGSGDAAGGARPAPVMSWVPQRLLPASDGHADRACWISTTTPIQSWRPRSRHACAWPRLARHRIGRFDGRRRSGLRPPASRRARLLRRSRRQRCALSGQAGRPARRRARLRRLGYAHQ